MNEELIKNLKKLMNDNETPENINNSLVYIYKQDIKEIYDCLMGVDLFKLFKIKANIENDTKLIGLIKLLLSKAVTLVILPILTGGITSILINTLNEEYKQYKQYIFIFLGLILYIVFLCIICYFRKKIKTKNKLIGKKSPIHPGKQGEFYGHRVLGTYNHNFIILFIFYIYCYF